MSKDYTDSCFLSKAKDKRSQNSPDYYGQIEFSQDTIRYLAEQLRAGAEPKLRVAVWRKENERGVYLSMQLSVPRAQEGGERRVRVRAQSQQRPTRQLPPESEDDFDDEIPF